MTGPPASDDDEIELPEAETKVFRSGNSDAVRVPKGFLDTGMRVKVRKLPNGDILVRPLEMRRWPKGFFESFGNLPDDFEVPPRDPYSPEDDERDANLFSWLDEPENK